MKRLKGPELKMPELKAPAFLTDLYYDLRDRRLLPLVALALVAIAAAPFLLGSKSEGVSSLPVGGPSAAIEAAGGKGSSLTVVEATPGLRDYRKRLRDRTPTDPFKQRYTGLPKSAQVLSEVVGSESSVSTSTSSGSSEGSVSAEVEATGGNAEGGQSPSSGGGSSTAHHGGTSPNGSGSGGGKKPHLVLFDYAIDAQIVYSPPGGDSGTQQQEPVVKHHVLPQTPLPGEKAPVVTYLGPGRRQHDKTTGRVLLAVSGDVSSIAGQHHCVSSAHSGGICELLEVRPGFPLTFAYGQAGAHYTIKVLSIELVVTGHA